MLGTPPAFVLSQDQTLHKSYIMKNLDGSFKKLTCVRFACATQLCVYSKRVRHNWLILTLLTLFSFQRTPDHLTVIASPRLTADLYYNTFDFLCQHVIFSLVVSRTGNSLIIPYLTLLCQVFFKLCFQLHCTTHAANKHYIEAKASHTYF